MERHLAKLENTVFTDATLYPWNRHTNYIKAASVVVDNAGKLITCATTRSARIVEAEEVAVALAAAEGYRKDKSMVILTDSKETCRNYTKGRICRAALAILRKAEHLRHTATHKLIWIPAHTGIEGNERADSLAREITYRVERPHALGQHFTVEIGYSELLNYHRGKRIRYSPPHKALTQQEAASWRRLQTGTFSNLHILSKMYPTQFRNTCPWCGATPTLYHITWECKRNYTFHQHKTPSAEQWESRLTSCELAAQRAMVQHASEAARLSGALD